ncbi:MAG: alpha/beta fold hydrolase [Anaerolineae bacterium]
MTTTVKLRRGRWTWANHPLSTRREASENVYTYSYSFSRLVEAGLIARDHFLRFQERTGLADFFWRVTFRRGTGAQTRQASNRLSRAEGFVVFMHGWDGSGLIWENLPAQVCAANARLVCLTPDLNGFGHSPFLESGMPRIGHCTPRANMLAVEYWLRLAGLFQPDGRQLFTFVGHSMSGASLFYKSQIDWEPSRYARLALAPALLNNDVMKKGFYQLLGVGIGTGLGYTFLDRFKDKLAPGVVKGLISGASQAVKNEHERIFATTAKGTLAQTFFAMGLAEEHPVQQRTWSRFRVIFGHRDRLVSLNLALELMAQLGLQSENVRVLLGDHYFFSVGQRTRRLHGPNRRAVLQEILELHRANAQACGR